MLAEFTREHQKPPCMTNCHKPPLRRTHRDNRGRACEVDGVCNGKGYCPLGGPKVPKLSPHACLRVSTQSLVVDERVMLPR